VSPNNLNNNLKQYKATPMSINNPSYTAQTPTSPAAVAERFAQLDTQSQSSQQVQDRVVSGYASQGGDPNAFRSSDHAQVNTHVGRDGMAYAIDGNGNPYTDHAGRNMTIDQMQRVANSSNIKEGESIELRPQQDTVTDPYTAQTQLDDGFISSDAALDPKYVVPQESITDAYTTDGQNINGYHSQIHNRLGSVIQQHNSSVSAVEKDIRSFAKSNLDAVARNNFNNVMDGGTPAQKEAVSAHLLTMFCEHYGF
jgi:hypothetical protein